MEKDHYLFQDIVEEYKQLERAILNAERQWGPINDLKSHNEPLAKKLAGMAAAGREHTMRTWIPKKTKRFLFFFTWKVTDLERIDKVGNMQHYFLKIESMLAV
ncbi:hypothetical protein ACFLZ7_02785 [Nanoarchaeota archaeon]